MTLPAGYMDFLMKVGEYRDRHPNTRRGQAMFNVLSEIRPDLASGITGSFRDPFYDSHRVPYFLQFLRENWDEKEIDWEAPMGEDTDLKRIEPDEESMQAVIRVMRARMRALSDRKTQLDEEASDLEDEIDSLSTAITAMENHYGSEPDGDADDQVKKVPRGRGRVR